MDFTLDHVTLVMNKTPCYAATSIELRADEEIAEIEIRTTDEVTVEDMVEESKKPIDYSEYENRLNKLKPAK
jgi:hypothetical protein